jgi:hypothetical protein
MDLISQATERTLEEGIQDGFSWNKEQSASPRFLRLSFVQIR